MEPTDSDTGYSLEPPVDEARRQRPLIGMIGAGAIAALIMMVYSFIR